jgi:hypothetical protein
MSTSTALKRKYTYQQRRIQQQNRSLLDDVEDVPLDSIEKALQDAEAAIQRVQSQDGDKDAQERQEIIVSLQTSEFEENLDKFMRDMLDFLKSIQSADSDPDDKRRKFVELDDIIGINQSLAQLSPSTFAPVDLPKNYIQSIITRHTTKGDNMYKSIRLKSAKLVPYAAAGGVLAGAGYMWLQFRPTEKEFIKLFGEKAGTYLSQNVLSVTFQFAQLSMVIMEGVMSGKPLTKVVLAQLIKAGVNYVPMMIIGYVTGGVGWWGMIFIRVVINISTRQITQWVETTLIPNSKQQYEDAMVDQVAVELLKLEEQYKTVEVFTENGEHKVKQLGRQNLNKLKAKFGNRYIAVAGLAVLLTTLLTLRYVEIGTIVATGKLTLSLGSMATSAILAFLPEDWMYKCAEMGLNQYIWPPLMGMLAAKLSPQVQKLFHKVLGGADVKIGNTPGLAKLKHMLNEKLSLKLQWDLTWSYLAAHIVEEFTKTAGIQGAASVFTHHTLQDIHNTNWSLFANRMNIVMKHHVMSGDLQKLKDVPTLLFWSDQIIDSFKVGDFLRDESGNVMWKVKEDGFTVENGTEEKSVTEVLSEKNYFIDAKDRGIVEESGLLLPINSVVGDVAFLFQTTHDGRPMNNEDLVKDLIELKFPKKTLKAMVEHKRTFFKDMNYNLKTYQSIYSKNKSTLDVLENTHQSVLMSLEKYNLMKDLDGKKDAIFETDATFKKRMELTNDPNQLETYYNQVRASNIELKTNFRKNYGPYYDKFEELLTTQESLEQTIIQSESMKAVNMRAMSIAESNLAQEKSTKGWMSWGKTQKESQLESEISNLQANNKNIDDTTLLNLDKLAQTKTQFSEYHLHVAKEMKDTNESNYKKQLEDAEGQKQSYMLKLNEFNEKLKDWVERVKDVKNGGKKTGDSTSFSGLPTPPDIPKETLTDFKSNAQANEFSNLANQSHQKQGLSQQSQQKLTANQKQQQSLKNNMTQQKSQLLNHFQQNYTNMQAFANTHMNTEASKFLEKMSNLFAAGIDTDQESWKKLQDLSDQITFTQFNKLNINQELSKDESLKASCVGATYKMVTLSDGTAGVDPPEYSHCYKEAYLLQGITTILDGFLWGVSVSLGAVAGFMLGLIQGGPVGALAGVVTGAGKAGTVHTLLRVVFMDSYAWLCLHMVNDYESQLEKAEADRNYRLTSLETGMYIFASVSLQIMCSMPLGPKFSCSALKVKPRMYIDVKEFNTGMFAILRYFTGEHKLKEFVEREKEKLGRELTPEELEVLKVASVKSAQAWTALASSIASGSLPSMDVLRDVAYTVPDLLDYVMTKDPNEFGLKFLFGSDREMVGDQVISEPSTVLPIARELKTWFENNKDYSVLNFLRLYTSTIVLYTDRIPKLGPVIGAFREQITDWTGFQWINEREYNR